MTTNKPKSRLCCNLNQVSCIKGEEIKLTYDNGQVKIDGNLVDGKKEGKWVWYYESGKIEQEVNFVDGKKEGKEVW